MPRALSSCRLEVARPSTPDGGELLTLIVPRSPAPRESRLVVGLRSVGLAEWQGPACTITPRGAFLVLPSLGFGVAWFGDAGARDAALNALSERFDFVDNCSMAMAVGTQNPELTDTVPLDLWPEVSGVSTAHAAGIDGRGVTVAVLDTGIDADHGEFLGRTIPFRHVSLFPNSLFWPPRDVRGFDPGGHGTHVCGSLAGRHVGVAPGARLLVASVMESETTRTSLVRVAYGLDWVLGEVSRPGVAGQPAVLNLSVGFPNQDRSVTALEMEKRLGALRRIIHRLVDANVLPVVAVGNDGADECSQPGALPEVLAVGAVDSTGARAEFSGGSSLFPKPDMMGFGVSICSSSERDSHGRSLYRTRDGTSMAAPYVSGIAALYRSADPSMDVAATWNRLRETALPLSGERTGAGLARYKV